MIHGYNQWFTVCSQFHKMLIGKPPNNFANKFSWIALVPTTIIPIDSKSYYPQLTAQQWWFKFQKYLRRGYWKVPISVGWYGCFFSYMFDSKNQTFFRDFWFSVFGRHFSYIFDVRSVQSGRRKPKTKKRFCFSTQCIRWIQNPLLPLVYPQRGGFLGGVSADETKPIGATSIDAGRLIFSRLYPFQSDWYCSKKTSGSDPLVFLHTSGKNQRIHRTHPK